MAAISERARSARATRAVEAAPTHASADERAARGKAARAGVPRASHAAWAPASERRDVVEVLRQQAASRVPELVPIRHGRMLTSPFAFFRGAAAVMAADLAGTPRSGMQVQLCGDAHLSNFGGFASPERALVFDLNDFDETLPGPWEWDVKRLAASVELAARELACKPAARRGAVLATVRAYRDGMRRLAGMQNLDVWYDRLDAGQILETMGERAGRRQREAFRRNTEKAHSKDSMRALSRLTSGVSGRQRIVADPPLIVPVEDLLPGAPGEALEAEIRALLSAYASTLRTDRRRLLESYRYGHMARKVVGVGSVGTRAWIVLLLGRDEEDPLFLQVKEAQRSVLEPFTGSKPPENQGERVVTGQWAMQASGDIFLGWLRADGIDGQQRDFYVRQLWDWKLSADVEAMRPAGLSLYGELCGWTLARAHARSGDRVAIAAYLGTGEAFDRALADFAELYADQTELDYAVLTAAAADGTLPVQRDT
jgi:uncharacterized protein (DUF2252 family)